MNNMQTNYSSNIITQQDKDIILEGLDYLRNKCKSMIFVWQDESDYYENKIKDIDRIIEDLNK